ncbi:MAG: RagB/SusD family nutrient uptake outer membrane protein [Tannerella sp.]|jgi:hypothetical protein|nr:RagB/SusD family nutrient uptake outer membrane protein [Tannerella sp.]
MKKYLIGILLTGLIMTSCSDQLEVTPPNNITQEQIDELLKNGDEATRQLVFSGLVGGLPARFRANVPNGESVGRYNNAQGLDCMRNLEGNDVVFGDREPRSWGADEYMMRDLYSESAGKSVYYWDLGWENINTANKLLTYLTPDIVGESAVLKQYKAVALTVRAYYYNYLMENFQDAYMNGGSSKLGLMWYDTWNPLQPNKPRETAVQTYANIKADIAEAVSLFNATIGYTASTEDVDLGVAAFTQARVALCMGDWETVVAACDLILAKNSKLMTEDQYVQKLSRDTALYRADSTGFLNNARNPEVLLGWSASNSAKTSGAWRNIFTSSYGGSEECFWRIDDRLYERIDDNDYRKDNFLTEPFGEYLYPPESAGNTAYIPAYSNLKFAAMVGIGGGKDKATNNQVCDYYMRVSEVLLMKAEAQAQSNNEAGARETLNLLLAARTKAGAPTLTCDNYLGANGMTLMQLIQLQTRIEMWGERGLEFYNNKRWNIPVDRTSSKNHPSKITYPVNLMTMQIPKNELDYNPLCEPN